MKFSSQFSSLAPRPSTRALKKIESGDETIINIVPLMWKIEYNSTIL